MYFKHEPVLDDKEKAILKTVDKLWEVWYREIACNPDNRISTDYAGYGDDSFYQLGKRLWMSILEDVLDLSREYVEALDDLCSDTSEPPSTQLKNIPWKLLDR